MGEDQPARPEVRSARSRALRGLALLGLFAFGLAWCWRTAGDGFQPLDSPIVFDGGWRVLSGQVPFRDFVTAAGLPPIYLQALFFAVLGVSWSSYMLHAALLNGLYGLLVHGLLRRTGAGRVAALGYGAASTVVFYPPIGTPYLEQHAFFFVVLAAWLGVCAVTTIGRRAHLAAAGVVPALGLAFLSKQNVAVLGLAPVLASLWLARGAACRWRSLAAWTAVGALGGLVLALGLGWSSGMAAAQWRTYFLDLPSAVGRRRLGNVPAAAWLEVPFTWYFQALTPLLLAQAFVVALIWIPVRRFLRKRRILGQDAPRVAPVLVAGVWTLCGALFVTLTNNNPENGYPWMFLALGLVHAGRGALLPGSVGARALLALFLALLALRDAWLFDRAVNRTRVVQDISFDPGQAPRSRLPRLEGLRFQVYRRSPLTIQAIDEAVEFLRQQPGDIYVFGECTILYALTGRPSLNPYLWYHPGLTVPEPRTPEFQAMEERALASVAAHDVRWIVTGEGPTPDAWPRLAARLLARAVGEQRFGCLRVIELAPAR